ncbi:MAG: CU044_2847 family protein [Egibacteraceae bacterium]
MAELMAVPLKGGGSLVVEVDSLEGGPVKAGRVGRVVGEVAQTLEAALASVVPAASVLLDKLGEAKPSEICVQFGIKLTAEAGAVVTKTAGECNFAVMLHWRQTSADG